MKHLHFSKKTVIIVLSSVLLLISSLCLQSGGVSSTLASSTTSSDEPDSSFADFPLPQQSDSPSAIMTSDDPNDSNESIDAASTYQRVLQNKAEFFSTDANMYLNIDHLNQAVSNDCSATAKATKFAIVDLENDDTPEVILWLKVNNDDYYGFEVLRYQDGIVYGYTLWYRAFMDLKGDGTFSFSSSAADYGFGTMKFIEHAYSVNKISYCESDYDSNINQSVSYFVEYESATEDDFLSAINKQSEKKQATWYDFTDANIETMFSNFK